MATGQGGRNCAVFAGGVAGATAGQTERSGSLIEAEAIPTEMAEPETKAAAASTADKEAATEVNGA